MGPGDMSSSTSTVKLLNLPRLKDDGTNYILYKEWIPNVATSKGLRRVLYGTAKKPMEMTEINGDYYLPGNLTPLSDDEVEKQLTLQDAYDQKEAQVREMMYETISTLIFMQIKNEPTPPLQCGRSSLPSLRRKASRHRRTCSTSFKTSIALMMEISESTSPTCRG